MRERITTHLVHVHCRDCNRARAAYLVRDTETRKTYARCTYCGTYTETREAYGNACLPISPFACTASFYVATSEGGKHELRNGTCTAIAQDVSCYVFADADTKALRTVPLYNVLRAATDLETYWFRNGYISIRHAHETDSGLLVPYDYNADTEG